MTDLKVACKLFMSFGFKKTAAIKYFVIYSLAGIESKARQFADENSVQVNRMLITYQDADEDVITIETPSEWEGVVRGFQATQTKGPLPLTIRIFTNEDDAKTTTMDLLKTRSLPRQEKDSDCLPSKEAALKKKLDDFKQKTNDVQ